MKENLNIRTEKSEQTVSAQTSLAKNQDLFFTVCAIQHFEDYMYYKNWNMENICPKYTCPGIDPRTRRTPENQLEL